MSLDRPVSRRRVLRATAGGALVASVAATLSGCGQLQRLIGGGAPSELIMGYGVDQLEATGLDPQVHSGTVAESKLRNVYDCLVQMSKDLKTVEPQLATSWKRIDPLRMQLTLREGVKFHNGEDFDGEAVKFSIERPLKPETGSSIRTSYSTVIDHVDVVDKHTVNVVTKAPDPLLLRRLSGFNMTIVAPKWAAGGNDVLKKAANGTGSYRVVEWGGPQGDLVLEANPSYWAGTPPSVKRVRVKVIPEAATRVAALRAGDVHVAHALWPEDVDPINSSGNRVVKKVSSNRIIFWDFESRKPPFDNKLVRQAANYGANLDGIIKNVLQGNGDRVPTVSASWHTGFNKSLKPYPYDPDKARDLLRQAGYPNGVETNMWFFSGLIVKDKEVSEAIAQELTKVGIRTKANLVDTTRYTAMSNGMQLEGIMYGSWGNWMFDADNTYYPLYHTQARDACNGGKGCSRRHWSDPTFDKLLDQARVELLDEEKRAGLYDQAQARLYDEAPTLFGYTVVDIYGHDKRLSWQPRSDEMVWYREMSWSG